MECVAAMTVSFCQTWRSISKREASFFGYGVYNSKHSLSVRVKASGGSSKGDGGGGAGVGVAIKKGFADEEDYVKGGGPELLFVQMQQNKSMEKQSKLADKVNYSTHSLSLVHMFWFCFLVREALLFERLKVLSDNCFLVREALEY